MRENGIRLDECVDGKIYYGVKTGLNAAYVIGEAKRRELIGQDVKSAEIIKPLATGKNIKRWSVQAD